MIDTVGRLGGEEFAVILPGADLAAAQGLASRLCRTVATAPLLADGQEIGVTVSIGLTVMDGNESTAGAALERADAALYRAKELGRDRVVTGSGHCATALAASGAWPKSSPSLHRTRTGFLRSGNRGPRCP